MSAAIFGLVGVAVGSLMALTKDWILDRRVAGRQVEAERRSHRAAIRLVADEIDNQIIWWEEILSRKRFPIAEAYDDPQFMPTDEWEQHRAVLAEAIEDAALWSLLTAVYFNARGLKTVSGRSFASRELAEQDGRDVAGNLEDAQRARSALLELAG